jgi:protein-disulfide isomerase
VPLNAQTFSETQRGEIEGIVKAYLIAHPEVIQEVMTEIEKRQAEAEVEKHKEGVKQYSKVLFYSPRQVTLGNPDGDVTMVEFFDYNCGFCRRALADMLDLMKADPKLRVVLKEFPVLGPGSVEAAQVAVAVRMQDKDGKKYLEFHQKMLTGRGQADRARALAVAKEVGLDMGRLEKDMASDEAKETIDENLKMAEALGLNGTPSYVIGTDVVVGAVGLTALKEKVAAAR